MNSKPTTSAPVNESEAAGTPALSMFPAPRLRWVAIVGGTNILIGLLFFSASTALALLQLWPQFREMGYTRLIIGIVVTGLLAGVCVLSVLSGIGFLRRRHWGRDFALAWSGATLMLYACITAQLAPEGGHWYLVPLILFGMPALHGVVLLWCVLPAKRARVFAEYFRQQHPQELSGNAATARPRWLRVLETACVLIGMLGLLHGLFHVLFDTMAGDYVQIPGEFRIVYLASVVLQDFGYPLLLLLAGLTYLRQRQLDRDMVLIWLGATLAAVAYRILCLTEDVSVQLASFTNTVQRLREIVTWQDAVFILNIAYSCILLVFLIPPRRVAVFYRPTGREGAQAPESAQPEGPCSA